MVLAGRKYILSTPFSDDNKCHMNHRHPSQRALLVSRRIIKKIRSTEEHVQPTLITPIANKSMKGNVFKKSVKLKPSPVIPWWRGRKPVSAKQSFKSNMKNWSVLATLRPWVTLDKGYFPSVKLDRNLQNLNNNLHKLCSPALNVEAMRQGDLYWAEDY